MIISSFPKEPDAVDADGLGEGRRCHDLPEDELPLVPPAGKENQDLIIAIELGVEDREEDDAGGRGESGYVHHRSTTYIAVGMPCIEVVSPFQCGTTTRFGFLGRGIRIEAATP
ncbi:hypothetical protein D1007_23567 [Hordeum vulgare]|nr:hypothetical protein D1007_23567 [Hordeum vulgare]